MSTKTLSHKCKCWDLMTLENDRNVERYKCCCCWVGNNTTASIWPFDFKGKSKLIGTKLDILNAKKLKFFYFQQESGLIVVVGVVGHFIHIEHKPASIASLEWILMLDCEVLAIPRSFETSGQKAGGCGWSSKLSAMCKIDLVKWKVEKAQGIRTIPLPSAS